MRSARFVPHRRVALQAASLSIVLLASLLVGGRAGGATACPSPPEIFPIEDLAAGMTATGLTTISGATPTSFTVEILGVIPNGIMIGMDAIVGRVTGPGSFLDSTGGAFYGMSGSPVSIGDELVGVVSFGYYSDPTIVGLTPAEAMVGLFGFLGGGSTTVLGDVALTLPIRRAIARATGTSTLEVTGGLQPLPTPLGVSGLAGKRMRQLQKRLDGRGLDVRLFPSGSATMPDAVEPASFTPGQPIGSVVSYGDATIWAMGTTSVVCDAAVAAFGHSLFYDPPGAVQLGMTEANVLTIMHTAGMAGEVLGTLTDPVGVFTQDRYAGQVGTVGTLPETATILSDLSSPDTGISRTGQTDVVFQDDYWLADAAWTHLYGNLAAVFQRSGDGTSWLSWTIGGSTSDGMPFLIENRGMFWSDYDAMTTVNKLVNALYELSFNPFEDVTVTDVTVGGSITEDRLEGPITKVRTSSALQPQLRSRRVTRVRAGEWLTVAVTVSPTEGPLSRDTGAFSIEVPRRARGTYTLRVRGGRDRMYPPTWRADSFEELVQILSGGEHGNDLVLGGPFGRPSVEMQEIVTGRYPFVVKVVR